MLPVLRLQHERLLPALADMEHKLESMGHTGCPGSLRELVPQGRGWCKFVWPGYGENMRVLKWDDRPHRGQATGQETTMFGVAPQYAEINRTA